MFVFDTESTTLMFKLHGKECLQVHKELINLTGGQSLLSINK
jgi:hypothetical protein